MITNKKEANCDATTNQNLLMSNSTTCSNSGLYISQINGCNLGDNSFQLSLYEGLFRTVKSPSLFVKVHSNPVKFKPHKLNPAALALTNACPTNFYKASYLEKFNGALADFITSVKPGSKKYYTDIIHVPSAKNSKVSYVLEASTFEINAETRIIGIVLSETSKALQGELKLVENFKVGLSTSLSHELNNPINALIPLIEMMPSYFYGENKEDIKEMALTNAVLLKNKIKDLIDYTKMGTKNIRLNPREFYLDEVFEEIKKLFKTEVKNNLNTLITKIYNSRTSRLMIFADKERLQQILVKLVFNANKFTNKGKITVIAREVKENFDIRFTVKDTGIGITEDKKELLFATLTQKKTKGRVGELPGLGLEITKGLCKCMGAKLTVDSTVGKGTTFSFEIPECHIVILEDALGADLQQKNSRNQNKSKINPISTVQ